ncbi:MAG TPA: type I DNA topoisomerase [Candidatus Vogelbacteria bacterium]|nr:type I DNA topoisomerase [Candidatus Vogelbacteria bacterium]
MKLFIVESPAKAKTISNYLGKEYLVKASVGHIRDLPKSNKDAVDVEKNFKPKYIISPGKEKIVAEIKKMAQRAEEVILATDPDREGEAIAWHLKEVANLKNPLRVTYQEITEQAIKEAVKNPRPLDDNLIKAQEARRVLDRLFGYDLSSLIWKKLRYGLSAGRVQSPALRILAEKEREIKAFQPEKFWLVFANFKTENNDLLKMECLEKFKDEKTALNIITEGEKRKWQIDEVKEVESKRLPKAPFITSTLQQTASSRLGLSPSQTMRLAQKLYEAGHITYMRTDNTSVAQEALENIRKQIVKEYGQEYLKERVYASKSKNAQEAHEAIRPTDISKKIAGQDTTSKKLYDLIRTRTICSQMTEALFLKTTIIAKTDDDKIPAFSCSGSQLIKKGFLIADKKSLFDEELLPQVAKGEKLSLKDIYSEGKETEPPRRFSEAGLIKELEKRGIGRPSTYASIIKTIINRGYVEKENRSLKVTPTGEVVSEFLENNFKEYISDSFTANLENELDDIAGGNKKYEKVLSDFYQPFTKSIEAKKDLPKITNLGEAPEKIICPKCSGKMIIKLGRGGKFYSCARFPDCEGALTLKGKKLEGPKETGEKCPECDKGKLISRESRFGSFVGCSRYPKCRYIKNDEASDDQERPGSNGVLCPKCQKGTMVEKKGRFGTFYGCSNYPKCKNIIKTKPTGENCHLCGSLIMEGTKTIPNRCSNKNCPNHNPHKMGK